MKLSVACFICSLLLSPLLHGIINKTKAFFGGRKGQPLLQLYYDIFKLFRKGAVHSNTVSWIFTFTPIIVLSSLIAALMFLPFPVYGSMIAFRGDIILFVYLLGLARFVTILAAMDTGSTFEGMGASREATYSAIAEPAFFIALIVLLLQTSHFTLSEFSVGLIYYNWVQHTSVYLLITLALFVIMLSENCRVPFDDPNTHLELTMIHEVMILDYSGPDLGFMLYAASLKLWIFASIIVLFVFPIPVVNPIVIFFLYFIEVFVIAILIGIVESIIARLNFIKVPLMLLFSSVLSLIGLFLILRIKL